MNFEHKVLYSCNTIQYWPFMAYRYARWTVARELTLTFDKRNFIIWHVIFKTTYSTHGSKVLSKFRYPLRQLLAGVLQL